MDGNGRWAKKQELKRIEGHKEGVRVVKKITTHCVKLNVENLTLYTFSNENWFRPKTEVSSLMKLFVTTLNKEIKLLLDNNIRFKVIGDKNKLDFITRKKINDVEYLTERNTGMGMNLAISYGGRQEIITAVNNIISSKRIKINEKNFEKYLYTKNIDHPDLLIRTGKEKRVSNFLLWQIAYSEIYFSDSLWPDFNEKELDEIILDFQKRERRYGKTSQQIS
jgi:undecaprenyl diphosphate synthase